MFDKESGRIDLKTGKQSMSTPFLSIIVPCYKVAEYLPDFLKALERQTVERSLFEVIFIVDGCPDGSDDVISSWLQRVSLNARLFVTENRGVSAARNLGVEKARGEWLSFPDPDDELADNYLAEVCASLSSTTRPDLLVTKLVWCDATKKHQRHHPLDYRYEEGDRVFHLTEDPRFIQSAVHTAFFRRDRIAQARIAFDTRLTVAEDQKFVAQYLLTFDDPVVSIVTSAKYFYKLRPDASGALAAGDRDPIPRYVSVIENSLFELLDQSGPKPPRWLENIVLYEIAWLFRRAFALRDSIHGADPASLTYLADLVEELLRRLSPEAVWTFNAVNIKPEIRAIWMLSCAPGSFRPWVRRYRYDGKMNLTEFRYLTARGKQPAKIIVNGEPKKPAYQKTRSVSALGRHWIDEQIVWVEDGADIRFVPSSAMESAFIDDGKPHSDREISQRFGWNAPSRLPWRKRELPSHLERMVTHFRWVLRSHVVKSLGLLAQYFAVRLPITKRYRNAWLLMDRDTQANDNAEELFKFLRARNKKPIFFIIRKGTPDWFRLQRSGIRPIAFGSLRHFVALCNASHLISSHIDQYVVRPFSKWHLRKTWNFIFLQHGVTQSDLHRWLNSKDVQLFVTSTYAERESLVSDGTAYIFTEKEVRLTGMARHDRLISAMDEPAHKNVVLIMPTWRSYLLTGNTSSGNDREARVEFSESNYVQHWSNLINDPELYELARKQGLELVLLPHPNLAPHTELLRVPRSLRTASYTRDDIASLSARCAVSITDYSSQAFEAAFCMAPTVYFQFDSEEFWGGKHIGSPGYFDYEKHGFGPVVERPSEVVRSLELLMDPGNSLTQEYLRRIQDLFPFRDGMARARIVREIEALQDRMPE